MVNETKHVEWSEGEYYGVTLFAILNVIIIMLILMKMVKVYPKYSKAINANLYMIIVLVTLLVRSINFLLASTEFLFKFTESCINGEINGCRRCNISLGINRVLLLTQVVTRILIFLQALQINFQRFPLLAYPHKFILGGKIFYVLFGISFILIATVNYPLNPSIYSLANNNSIRICLQGLDGEARKHRRGLIDASVPFLILSNILFCVLFVIKAVKLYRFTKDNITSSDPKKIAYGLRLLRSILKTMLRHTILVLCITFSLLFVLAIPVIANPDGMSLDSVDGIIVGLCIYMMYPFGEGLFNLIFGCCTSRLLKSWIEYEYRSTYNKAVEFASESSKIIGKSSSASSRSSKSVVTAAMSSSSHGKYRETESSSNSKDHTLIQFTVPNDPKKVRNMPDLSIIVEESQTKTRDCTITGPRPDFTNWSISNLDKDSSDVGNSTLN